MADVFEDLMAGAPAPTSDERDAREPLDARDELSLPSVMSDEMEAGLAALYGDTFPYLVVDEPEDDEWVAWAEDLWQRHSGSTTKRRHLSVRNRQIRAGNHWISSAGGGWKTPPKPKDAARIVYNMVGAALNQRAQIVSEQRPGFKTRPNTREVDDVKKAEAKQVALEYQYDQQEMPDITKSAVYWNGTDGVSFLELYWDPDAGPWHEAYGFNEQSGAEEPLGPDGAPAESPHKFRLGDIKTRVRKLEQVRVSANASSTEKPWYWIIRDVMPLAEAVRVYGDQVAQTEDRSFEDDATIDPPQERLGYQLPRDTELLNDQETVDRYTVYCEEGDFLPEGLTLIVVGDIVVFIGPLLPGVVPMVRWTDGSPDPSWTPRPFVDDWVESNMQVNAVLSKWVENVRLNAGPKLLAKRQAISNETLVGGTMTIIEARGLGDLNQLVKPLEAFSIGTDAKDLLTIKIKHFEDLSGWNDVSRGQFSAEASGRAILAIREQLERTFAPPVNAAAKAMTSWAKISCAWMAWGYDVPRMLGVQGQGRPDLVRAISSDDLDGTTDVWIDPETLMPLPRALRLQLLDEMFAKGQITAREHRNRLPFAWVRDIQYHDEVHAARARRVAEALRQGQWLPVLPMDDPQIHIEVLEKEILLQDNIPEEVKALAFERWQQLSQLLQMRMAGMLPGTSPIGGDPQGAQPAPGGSPPIGNPRTQPFQGTSPGVSAGTLSKLGGQTDETKAARDFDRRTQR